MLHLVALGLFAVAGAILYNGRKTLDLSELKAAAADLDTVGASVGAVIDNLLSKLEAANGNQAEIDALVAQLRGDRAEIIEAVQRGTVAEDEDPVGEIDANDDDPTAEGDEPGTDTIGG